jgi:hypothetical protein
MLRQRMLLARIRALGEAAASDPTSAASQELERARSAADRLIAITKELLDPILGRFPPE